MNRNFNLVTLERKRKITKVGKKTVLRRIS
jgi:hypothetical protein